GHSADVTSFAFAASGYLAASGDAKGVVRLWTVDWDDRSGIPLLGHAAPIDAVLFSGDSERLISRSSDGEVRVWRLHLPARSFDVGTRRRLAGDRHDAGRNWVAAETSVYLGALSTRAQENGHTFLDLSKESPQRLVFARNGR